MAWHRLQTLLTSLLHCWLCVSYTGGAVLRDPSADGMRRDKASTASSWVAGSFIRVHDDDQYIVLCLGLTA
jgi:hypothetical protein